MYTNDIDASFDLDPNNPRVRNSVAKLTESSANPLNDTMEVSVGVDISNVNLTRHSVGILPTEKPNVSAINVKLTFEIGRRLEAAARIGAD